MQGSNWGLFCFEFFLPFPLGLRKDVHSGKQKGRCFSNSPRARRSTLLLTPYVPNLLELFAPYSV